MSSVLFILVRYHYLCSCKKSRILTLKILSWFINVVGVVLFASPMLVTEALMLDVLSSDIRNWSNFTEHCNSSLHICEREKTFSPVTSFIFNAGFSIPCEKKELHKCTIKHLKKKYRRLEQFCDVGKFCDFKYSSRELFVKWGGVGGWGGGGGSL